MKIGILTMSHGVNYGNRLQNYAVQFTLEKLGCKAETIKNYTNQKIIRDSSIKERLKNKVIDIYFNNNINIRWMNYRLRSKRFKYFNKQYIKYSNFIISKDNIPKHIDDYYDYFVCGSDQIWNPEFPINSHIDFLTFVKEEKRIAYSPSFGISKLPEYCKKDYKKWINGIPNLSVRELAGAKIIKDLTGKDAQVLVDPTLNLTKEEWLSMAKKPQFTVSNKYIFSYFLGNVSDKIKNKIKGIAKQYNFEIIDILDADKKHIFSTDPSEFIWLLNNAELICTNSFHGTIFSIIMKKPFIVFERNDKYSSMNSRMDTLLKLFNMEHRLHDNINYTKSEVFYMDFKKVDEIINNEKEKSIKYLKKCLNL